MNTKENGVVVVLSQTVISYYGNGQPTENLTFLERATVLGLKSLDGKWKGREPLSYSNSCKLLAIVLAVLHRASYFIQDHCNF